MKNLCIIVNTHSSQKDVWPMFFGQLEKHCPKIKTYIFTDEGTGVPEGYETVIYNKNEMFRTQYLECLKKVSEEFLIYLNEDYVLYDDVNFEKIKEYIQVLENDPEISCIRFTRAGNITDKKLKEDLFYLSHDKSNFFSQTAGIWRRKILQKIHELGPDTHIASGGDQYGHFEVDANEVCKNLNLKGLIAYNNEPKRLGASHYDSSVFPYVATALVRGRWNLREYTNELFPLLSKYGIDFSKRGAF